MSSTPFNIKKNNKIRGTIISQQSLEEKLLMVDKKVNVNNKLK